MTNQLSGYAYDANGNQISSGYGYDAENRIVSANAGGVEYLYDAQNKRVWQGNFSGGVLTGQSVTLFGADGKMVATYGIGLVGAAVSFNTMQQRTYFGGKLVGEGVPGGMASVVQDRLGSVGKYYPYGEERNAPPLANDQVKFATYTRDAATGNDYADQRYYSSALGRFMTPDRDSSSATPSDPQSWNRYLYTQGDPLNDNDPSGLSPSRPPVPAPMFYDSCDNGGCGGGGPAGGCGFYAWLPYPGEGSGGYWDCMFSGIGLTYIVEGPTGSGPAETGAHDLSQRGLDCIKSYEQLELRPYRDQGGKLTIGYGHLVTRGQDFSQGITADQADELLRSDAAAAIQAVRDDVSVPLSQNQFDALVSFVFNVGAGGFAGSTLLSDLNSGRPVTEADFTAWNKFHVPGGGVGVSAGLTNRREDEYNLFSTGSSQKCPQ